MRDKVWSGPTGDNHEPIQSRSSLEYQTQPTIKLVDLPEQGVAKTWMVCRAQALVVLLGRETLGSLGRCAFGALM